MKSVLFCYLSFLISFQSFAFEVIAHRGVHQTYSRDGLTNDSCTAVKMDPPSHEFLENTVASIQRAFDLGASTVEIDIHPTTEPDPANNRLVLFHDWTLDCRTEARCEKECVTDKQSWNFMKTLDVGYGYTADGGQTFPFRGKGIGMIPTFKQAIALLEKNPAKKILVNVKDTYPRTQELLLKELSEFPVEIRSRVMVEFAPEYQKRFQDLQIPEAIWQGHGLKKCLSKYLVTGWTGYVPEPCRNQKFFVPLQMNLEILSPKLKGIQVTQVIWGWPEKFLERLNRHGSEVYLSEVESAEDLKFAQDHQFPGIMTNKIEVIGPLVTKP